MHYNPLSRQARLAQQIRQVTGEENHNKKQMQNTEAKMYVSAFALSISLPHSFIAIIIQAALGRINLLYVSA